MALTVRQSRMLGTSDGAAATVAPAVLLPKSVWTTQPQQAVGIDWGNPIARGLSFAAIPAAGDAVSGAKPVLSGSSSLSANQSGRAYKSPTTQIPGAWAFTVNIPSSFDVTVFAVVRNVTAQTVVVTIPTLNFNSTEPVLFCTSGSQTVFSTTNNASTIITTLSAGKVYSLAGVKRVNSQEQYIDGQKSTTNVTGNRSVGAITTVSVGRPGGGNNLENCEYSLVCYFNRALSESEVNSLSKNPWQIFKPLNRQVWVAP